MGLNWAELKLESGSSGFVPKTMSEILSDLSMINDDSVKAMKLNNYMHVMQDELRKIDAFKRELPLCTRLLNDAVERLKEERVQCTEREVGPVMTEFLPLKGNSEGDGGAKWSNGDADKKNWMSSAQLWAAGARFEKPHIKEQNFVLALESSEKESDGSEFERPYLQRSIFRDCGGAFLPSKGQPGLTLTPMAELLPSYGPPMFAPAGSPDWDQKGKRTSRASSRVKSQDMLEEESSKKPRRCWSPELHKLFVEALEKLGGAHKATPKQIKEKMNIESLTADEIKSHLQKFRLHLNKGARPRPRSLTAAAAPSPSPSAAPSQSPSACQSYFKGSCSNTSGSPDGPFYYGGESSKGVSVISVDDEEDVKSESHSWRGLLQK